MTGDDDPEKRIADLERPLLQSAADSEAAAAGTRTGLRLGWIALALMVVSLIVGGGAILAGRSGELISGEPTTEPMVGGGGTVAEIPSTPMLSPAVPTTGSASTVAPTDSPASASTPPPGQTVSVSGVGNERSIACTDNGVSISGVDNKVVLTGHCSRVDVSGVENTVTIDAADEIDVSGMNNVVTFHSGNPELSNSGIGNTLGQG